MFNVPQESTILHGGLIKKQDKNNGYDRVDMSFPKVPGATGEGVTPMSPGDLPRGDCLCGDAI